MTAKAADDAPPGAPRVALVPPGGLDPDDLELARGLARGAVPGLVRVIATPASRAGLGASVVTAALMARAGARPLLSVAVALLAGMTAERLYEMAEDIHGTALAQRAHLEKLSGDAAREV